MLLSIRLIHLYEFPIQGSMSRELKLAPAPRRSMNINSSDNVFILFSSFYILLLSRLIKAYRGSF